MKKEKVSYVAEADKFKKMAAALQDAQDFLNAYRVLQAHNRACPTTNQQPIFTPDIVNLAFAIELLLKALLYSAGKKVRSHKFNELFELLPSQTQAEIKKAFAEHIIKTTGRDQDIFGFTFESRLEQYSDTFQYWRYFHEKGRGTFDSPFCESLAHVLSEMAKNSF